MSAANLKRIWRRGSAFLPLVLALIGIPALVPAFAEEDSIAQSGSPNPPQVSTPAEMERTRQLNQQMLQGTTASPGSLNGQYPDVPQSTQAPAGGAMVDERQKQYQEQLKQYQADRQQYEMDLHNYDRAEWAYEDFPQRTYSYRYDDDRYARRLYLLADPTHQLAQKPIEDPSGDWVGKVRNIETASNGSPARVEVALNRRVAVWVSPNHFRYNPVDGVLLTDLTRADLWNMPGSTVGSER